MKRSEPFSTVIREEDGTVHATNPTHSLTIMPDGPNRAFNRTFVDYQMGGGKIHARLNNLAARLQNGKTTEDEAVKEIQSWVKYWEGDTTTRWLVGELDGQGKPVRCYIMGDHIIMTTQELRK